MGAYKKYMSDQVNMALIELIEPDNLTDVLFTALSNVFVESSWKSKRHFNGQELDDGEFVAGIDTPKGIFVHRFESSYWDLLKCQVLEKSKNWDWKAMRDSNRLLSLEVVK